MKKVLLNKIILSSLGTSILFLGSVSASNQMINGTSSQYGPYGPNAVDAVGINSGSVYLDGRDVTVIGGSFHNARLSDGRFV